LPAHEDAYFCHFFLIVSENLAFRARPIIPIKDPASFASWRIVLPALNKISDGSRCMDRWPELSEDQNSHSNHSMPQLLFLIPSSKTVPTETRGQKGAYSHYQQELLVKCSSPFNTLILGVRKVPTSEGLSRTSD
jgi:hypothetical protein